ncbi:MAG TPA: pilin [Candidatus Saccharimonadales bacterium]|nr:pilin [Candidatus Saccharimonadales bacterium]
MDIFSSIAPAIKLFADSCGGSSTTFFGLPVWYKYLAIKASSTSACNFNGFSLFNGSNFAPDNILLILLAVLDDLLIIAGIVAVVFVIYGGVRYILSSGEPENVKAAQSTILNALIGLVISAVAATLVNYIGFAFGGGK